MEGQQWAEGTRHREGRITARGPVAHDRRVHRVALRSVHERIDDVVGIGDDHELQGRGRQMIAVEIACADQCEGRAVDQYIIAPPPTRIVAPVTKLA